MITHVYDFLEKSALKYKDKILFYEDNKSISYKDFDLLCKQLSSKLLELDIHNSSVLIILPKSIGCLAGFFGVALSGNFYTLLDENTPIDRIKVAADVLKPKIIISNKELDLNIPQISPKDFSSFSINNKLIEQARQKHIDTNLLYVLFTSGSTGTPKGVSISHKSVIDYTFWVEKTFNIKEDEVLANQSPFYFDNSILDIFTTIKAGASLHLIKNNLFAFPNKVLSYIQEHKVSMIFWVPSVLIYFANTNALSKFDLSSLKKVLFAGEIMPNKQLNIWRNHLKNALFANLYGPTEITDVCAYYIVNRDFKDDELLPIGKACKNTELLVFDENMKLITKPYQKGELYVRGTGLSLGYFANKEKTNEAFIQNPLHDNYQDIVYKTGDVVAYNEFDELLCYGRADNQIKFMGHRIELGEIESVVGGGNLVMNNACIFKDNQIICFYQATNEIPLKEYLLSKLPPYMVPKVFIRVDEFKLNANGKIDRKVLQNYEPNR